MLSLCAIIYFITVPQMHTNLEDEVAAIPQNFPYLVLVSENTQLQLYVAVERLVLHECTSITPGRCKVTYFCVLHTQH